MQDSKRLPMLIFLIFLVFFFQSKSQFHGRKKQPFRKVVMDEEERDDIEIDDI